MGTVKTTCNFALLTNRYPRNIAVNLKSFKAEEFSTFLSRYLLHLVYGRINNKTYQVLQRLVFSISKATGLELTHMEIDEIEYQMNEFLKWFYATFYRGKAANLAVCKYTVHALSHLAQNLRYWGATSYYWQYTEVCKFLFFEANHLRNGYVGSLQEASKARSLVLKISLFSCINMSSFPLQPNFAFSIA
jgi:hypothetical protein